MITQVDALRVHLADRGWRITEREVATTWWAVEIWLVVEFDGQVGKARVFMVDSESLEVTREYLTEVHVP